MNLDFLLIPGVIILCIFYTIFFTRLVILHGIRVLKFIKYDST